jgi:hypothetical protein
MNYSLLRNRLSQSALYLLFVVALIGATCYVGSNAWDQATAIGQLTGTELDSQIGAAHFSLNLTAAGFFLLLAFWIPLVSVYIKKDILNSLEYFFSLLIIASLLISSLHIALAFGGTVISWLKTPVAGYSIARLILAGLAAAAVVGAAYYDFFRRKQRPE